MKKFYFFACFIFCSLILSLNFGCRDTCNKKMGKTFYNIIWENLTYSSATNKYIAGFSIDVLDALPVEYLRTASQKPIDNAAIDSIAFPDINQMNVYLKGDVIPAKNENKLFQFQMNMDDRQDYTNCVHPGAPDKYEINISFTIKNTDDSLNINNVSWSESVNKGAI